MKLYVMRHGPAEDGSPTGQDADRPLSPPGRERVRAVAKALMAAEEAPLHVIASPLVRALQTAEIVALITDLTDPVEVRREMAPGGDNHALVSELVKAGRERVMVVGHEPDLSMLVMRLLGRFPDSGGMDKAMVVSAELTPATDGTLAFTAGERFVLEPKTQTLRRS